MIRSFATRAAMISMGMLALSPAPANAHPHIFAEARLEVVVDADRNVEAVRHVWRFDELFSSTVLLDFDVNTNLELEPDELRAVGEIVLDSLYDFNYYTALSAGGVDIPIEKPDVINVDFQDGQLLMFFSVAPAQKLPLKGNLSFGAYDPTMYASLDFISDDDLIVEGPSQQCKKEVVRPNYDEILAQNQQNLTEAFFNDPAGNDISKLFATRLDLTC